jgi:acyl-[acyl-carrier-protein]-phospholipid O-acyltransferase/long-chain-fatty-acid--[acyl-carrier-protein] ligase
MTSTPTARLTPAGLLGLALAQFGAAFNDNLFRVTLILLCHNLFDPQVGGMVAALAGLTLLLPYALLGVLAGKLCDRTDKRAIIRGAKLLELILVPIGLVGLSMLNESRSTTSITLLLVVLGLLGVQAAFLTPARYGALGDLLGPKELPKANGILELGSYGGILAGTLVAGFLANSYAVPGTYPWAWWLVPIVTLIGLAGTWLVPSTPVADANASLADGYNPVRIYRSFQDLAAVPGLGMTVFGQTVFWGLSMLIALSYAGYAQGVLEYTQPVEQNRLMLALSLGVGVGSCLAGRWSRGMVELGLLPFGFGLWGLAMLLLALAGALGTWLLVPWVLLLMAAAGFGGGVFIVPLNVNLQRRSPEERRATFIGLSNVATVGGMVAACLIHFVLAGLGGMETRWLFLGMGVLLAVGAGIAARQVWPWFIRRLLIIVTHLLFRIEVRGRENMPEEGPVLLAMNHQSFADGNIIFSIFNRFVRFVVYKAHFDNPYFNWMAEPLKMVPIDAEGSPRELVKSLRTASDLLAAGELLVIFPEGGISRTGSMQPFRRGYETIVKKAGVDVPIVPGYIDGVWDTIFSFQGGAFFKKPWRFGRTRIRVIVGQPLPSDTPPEKLREAIRLLEVEAFKARTADMKPAHREFIRFARRNPRLPHAADMNTPMNTYGDSLMKSVVFARILGRKLGDEPMVGLLVPPTVAGMLANIAVAHLGKTSVNLNYTTSNETVNQCILQAGVKQVITSKLFLHRVKLQPNAELIYLEDLKGEVTKYDKAAALAARIMPAWFTERFLFDMSRHSMRDILTIIFSSGSTGQPKGVMLTHANIVGNVASVVQHIDFSSKDRLMGVLPLFHSFGYTGTIWLPAARGAGIVYHYNPLEAETVGKLIRDHKCTLFLSTNTFLRNYIRKCDDGDFKTVRMVICGAEKLQKTVSDQFEKKFGLRPSEGYGCTELSPVVSANRADIDSNGVKQVATKDGTIGHPVPGVAVKVVDPDTLAPLPTGEPGMLMVAGVNVMKGYLNKPEATVEAIRDGWYITGDIAKLDEDGFITITDRLSRFSKIGGEMVPHGRVEEELHRAIDIHEQVFAVAGLPDDRRGERLIVLHLKSANVQLDDVMPKLNEALPALWVPDRKRFYSVEAIPVLGTGKVDLKGLRKMAAELDAAPG